ncbi:hypothetical protein PT974_11647 [Cladobotryum mycophilum]|uniref:Uncharacterized protein n=1 Tax=Cladobotryum mycophilum TaxID=491253 RepID=A0ABR0S770_9HYPO
MSLFAGARSTILLYDFLMIDPSGVVRRIGSNKAQIWVMMGSLPSPPYKATIENSSGGRKRSRASERIPGRIISSNEEIINHQREARTAPPLQKNLYKLQKLTPGKLASSSRQPGPQGYLLCGNHIGHPHGELGKSWAAVTSEYRVRRSQQ